MKGFLGTLCVLISALSPTAAAEIPPDQCVRTPDMPVGLRMGLYRRATPHCAPGVTTLSTSDLDALLTRDADTVLIDVWAILLRTEPDFGSEWLPNKPHKSLPGAIWLPNVGYGELKEPVASWFDTQLTRLSGGDRDRSLVFFCVADCWMSWNVVQRVARQGYRGVYWYKLGTDGWLDAGRKLVPVEPVPIEAFPD